MSVESDSAQVTCFLREKIVLADTHHCCSARFFAKGKLFLKLIKLLKAMSIWKVHIIRALLAVNSVRVRHAFRQVKSTSLTLAKHLRASKKGVYGAKSHPASGCEMFHYMKVP